ncbi:DUF4087 domain-containing protein [Tabrizicola sp.]|uniref:DUF4087 domain-containing protein n=1 Tax=Tabrizicola sp. TaxID=2005166 RepID=UPI003F3B25A5
MQRKILTLIATLITTPALATAETRCGWYFDYLSAGVILLVDADAHWLIMPNGGEPPPGFETAYTLAFDNREEQFESISYDNINFLVYRYSCACIDGEFGPITSEDVIAITRMKGLPLSQCFNDQNLPMPQLEG